MTLVVILEVEDLSSEKDGGILMKCITEGTGYKTPADLATAQLHYKLAREDGSIIEDTRGGVPLYDSTFSRTVWSLYDGAKGLVAWYYRRGFPG